jgi:hypothetical protein
MSGWSHRMLQVNSHDAVDGGGRLTDSGGGKRTLIMCSTSTTETIIVTSLVYM